MSSFALPQAQRPHLSSQSEPFIQNHTMGVKRFMMSFIFTSFFLSLLFIPTLLRKPASIAKRAGAAISLPHGRSNSNSSYPVNFAYLISASKGDVDKLKRVLTALYHPANYYLLHLDLEASPEERQRLVEFVRNHPVFREVENVWIVGKSNLVTYRGPTMLANTLHSMSVLLRVCKWDWFINLSASDYPLVTQDDLISAFSNLPRDLNFVQHSSRLGWKLDQRAKPIVLDPGLDGINKSDLIWVPEQRTLPSTFKLFTGSAWVVLSRSFTEYSIVGWNNLPRILLLYYTNFISSPEGYFQTLICNSKEYKNTVLSDDLHFVKWDNPPKQHPLSLGLKDYRKMILRSVPFARKFEGNDPVLDKIDRELLHRNPGKFTYGGWCSAGKDSRSCSGHENWENYGVLHPGIGSRRLKSLINKLMLARKFKKKLCR